MWNSLATNAVNEGRSISAVGGKHLAKLVLVLQKSIREIFLSTQIHRKSYGNNRLASSAC